MPDAASKVPVIEHIPDEFLRIKLSAHSLEFVSP